MNKQKAQTYVEQMWLGISAGILTTLLMAFRVKAAIIIGIAFATIISWP